MNYKTTSPGKLLITSEYFVLKGALALAIPTKFNQTLEFIANHSNKLIWEAYDEKNLIWFDCEFGLPDLEIIKNKNETTKVLQSYYYQQKN